jgi:hypothetical protein
MSSLHVETLRLRSPRSGENKLIGPQENSSEVSSMESCAMSDHQLKFKGPGFDFDAKGWMAIGAAIVIVLLVLLVPRLFY